MRDWTGWPTRSRARSKRLRGRDLSFVALPTAPPCILEAASRSRQSSPPHCHLHCPHQSQSLPQPQRRQSPPARPRHTTPQTAHLLFRRLLSPQISGLIPHRCLKYHWRLRPLTAQQSTPYEASSGEPRLCLSMSSTDGPKVWQSEDYALVLLLELPVEAPLRNGHRLPVLARRAHGASADARRSLFCPGSGSGRVAVLMPLVDSSGCAPSEALDAQRESPLRPGQLATHCSTLCEVLLASDHGQDNVDEYLVEALITMLCQASSAAQFTMAFLPFEPAAGECPSIEEFHAMLCTSRFETPEALRDALYANFSGLLVRLCVGSLCVTPPPESVWGPHVPVLGCTDARAGPSHGRPRI